MKSKSSLFTIAFLFIAMYSIAQVKGTFTDPRDGKTYNTIEIGSQIWMAENLAYKVTNGCWAYNYNNNNVVKYGYLYNWKTAKNACPPGWHLPSDEEWTILINYLGGKKVAGAKLKNKSGWNEENKGTNDSGFSALPGGYHSNNGTFYHLGLNGYWYSSSEVETYSAWSRSLSHDSNTVSKYDDNILDGLSIRCIKD